MLWLRTETIFVLNIYTETKPLAGLEILTKRRLYLRVKADLQEYHNRVVWEIHVTKHKESKGDEKNPCWCKIFKCSGSRM